MRRMSKTARLLETAAAPEPPPVTSSRRGLRLRHVKGGAQSFFEVEHPGELERVKPDLTPAEFDAGIMLRLLWARGTMNPEATSSSTSRLGMPRAAFTDDHDDDKRCEAQDELRAACRAMGYLGMGGRLAVEVVVYERRVTSQDALLYLRQALSLLAEHLRSAARRAA
jgi:hypothetical protein